MTPPGGPAVPPAPGAGGGLPGGTPPPAPAPFAAEGLLKDALARLWEQARSGGVERIGALTIRMFEAGDAFRLLGAVGAVSGPEKVVTMMTSPPASEEGTPARARRRSARRGRPRLW